MLEGEPKMTNKPTDSDWESSEVAERRNRGRARRAALQRPATELMLDLAEIRTGCRVSSTWRPVMPQPYLGRAIHSM